MKNVQKKEILSAIEMKSVKGGGRLTPAEERMVLATAKLATYR